MKVKITKIAQAPDARFQSAKMDQYVPGQINDNLSLPIEYWCEGNLIRPIEIGRPLVIARTIRNGVEATGTMITSEVTSIKHDQITTKNSIYNIEYLE